jgi:hypothetical protein
MELKQVAGKSLLTISSDNEFIYGTHIVKIDNENDISFSYNNIVPMQVAEKTIEKRLFAEIINLCENLVKNDLIPEIANYKNTERLPVFLKETVKYFAVISFGEYQPALYRIYIEGIFEKQPF